MIGRFVRKTVSTISPTQEALLLADAILPNSNAEIGMLRKEFKIPVSAKLYVIPNAADDRFYYARPETFADKYGLCDYVLYVGRIEPRKNVLSLVRALRNEKDLTLVILGSDNPMETDYVKKVREEARRTEAKTLFIGPLSHESEMLASAYAAAKVFALPSWFETPGIAALEAALAGANVVITDRGGTKEYFKEYAAYVDPSSLDAIRKGVLNSYHADRNSKLKEHVLKNYSWEIVAKKTLKAYTDALSSTP